MKVRSLAMRGRSSGTDTLAAPASWAALSATERDRLRSLNARKLYTCVCSVAPSGCQRTHTHR
jgi:hypothetical protein